MDSIRFILRMLVILAVPALLSACHPRSRVSRSVLALRADEAMTNLETCAREQVSELDDGVSDGSTLALAVAARCASEYESVTSAWGLANLENDELRRRFRNGRNTAERRIEFFLPRVMEYRRVARVGPVLEQLRMEVETATSREVQCVAKGIVEIDDGKADDAEVAWRVAQRCARERAAAVEANIRIRPEADESEQREYRERSMSREERVRQYLPHVLEWRRTKAEKAADGTAGI